MNYEVVITRTQPSCGGKSPRTHEIRSVATDDVVAYVRQCEMDLPADLVLTPKDDGKGNISIEFKSGAEMITYEFSED